MIYNLGIWPGFFHYSKTIDKEIHKEMDGAMNEKKSTSIKDKITRLRSGQSRKIVLASAN